MVGENTRRAITLVSATLTMAGTVIAYKLTESLDNSQSLAIVGAWMAAGIVVTYLVSRLQARSQEESPRAPKEYVGRLKSELRKQVRARTYGARSTLIETPLTKLDLDIAPLVGWVRDPRLSEPERVSEQIEDDIVAAFESSSRRLLIVGEPGAGKTIAAYSLIEYLDEVEGEERIPLLVNLSAWEAKNDFETFLVDYLCSSVGYEVHERAVAREFINSSQYSLILDGLDEISAELRLHFSECLDEYVRGLLGEVAVVVTCRTQEYEDLLTAHPTGLGLVQAVEMLPLTSQQLDSAFAELAKVDKDWESLLSQRALTAYQRVRQLLRNPLFLNLAVVGHLNPSHLLNWTTTEQDLRDLVLDSYLDRTLAGQRQYNPEDARRYLTWIARFLNGVEVSPFSQMAGAHSPDEPPESGSYWDIFIDLTDLAGLTSVTLPREHWFDGKTSDSAVFNFLALTPPDPPIGYRLMGALVRGLGLGLILALVLGLAFGLVWGLVCGLALALVFGLPNGMLPSQWLPKRSAVSFRSPFVWPSTRRQLVDFLRTAGSQLLFGLVVGLGLGLAVMAFGTVLAMVMMIAVLFVVVGAPVARIGLHTLSRGALSMYGEYGNWREVREQDWRFTRGLLTGVLGGLGLGLILALVLGLAFGPVKGLIYGLVIGLILGLLLKMWAKLRPANTGLAWDLTMVVVIVLMALMGVLMGVLSMESRIVGLVYGLGWRPLRTRSVLIASRTPVEAISHSQIAALTCLAVGLVAGLGVGIIYGMVYGTGLGLVFGLVFGLVYGLDLALCNGGWFVLLQKTAHRRLAQAGNLPPHPYNFLEWGIERQIFRRVGGGVRFRHNVIQQRLVST